jgi:hypothetical protein
VEFRVVPFLVVVGREWDMIMENAWACRTYPRAPGLRIRLRCNGSVRLFLSEVVSVHGTPLYNAEVPWPQSEPAQAEPIR